MGVKGTDRQSGLAAVEAVLIAAIIVIIAGTGWYVFKARDSANKNLTSAADASQGSGSTASGSGNAAAADSDQNLQNDLDAINSAQNTASQDASSANSAVNDQNSEISVPTN